MKKLLIGAGIGLAVVAIFLTTLSQAATNIANNMAIVAQAQAVQSQADALQTQANALVLSQCISGVILVIGSMLAFAGGFGGFYLYSQWKINQQPMPGMYPGSYGGQYPQMHPRQTAPRMNGLPAGAQLLPGNQLFIPGQGIFQLTPYEARELAIINRGQLPGPQKQNSGQMILLTGEQPEEDDSYGLFDRWVS